MDDLIVVPPKDRLRTNRFGELAVAKVVLRAIEKGVALSRPIVECRYDLILDDGLKLYRTQVKYAGKSPDKQSQGMVPLSLQKWCNDGRARIPYYTAEEIDLLLVYVPRIDRILWLGPEVFDRRKNLSIRIEPAKNNQKKRCLMAADYYW